jgi:hypothetical protein
MENNKIVMMIIEPAIVICNTRRYCVFLPIIFIVIALLLNIIINPNAICGKTIEPKKDRSNPEEYVVV